MTQVVESALAVLLAAGSLYSLCWATYVLLMPLLSALRPGDASQPSIRSSSDQPPAIAVIIPAHDMGDVIEPCVAALRGCGYPAERMTIFVTADHCTDDTVVRAAAAGATVLVRSDEPPGKTYALAWSLAELAKRGLRFDLYVITDATARVRPRFLSCMAEFWQRGEDIVVGHSIVDLENQRWFAQCLGLTLVHRNLQNAARERLRLSSLIEGRGMAYGERYIRRHGWTLALPTTTVAGSHPTEDWRHGVRAVEHGYRVAFADKALVVTPLRETLAAATKQGVRWERGRMANAGTHAVRLLRSAVARRDRLMSFAALDAIQPPVAILAGTSLALATLGAWTLSLFPRLGLASMLPAALIGIYGVLVVLRGRRDGIRARTLLWAPVYVLWRCYAFVLAWTHGLRGKRP